MNFLKDHALALAIALLFDGVLGDLESWSHPVRWMGTLYQKLENFFRKARHLSYPAGLFTVFSIGSLFALGSWLSLAWVPQGWAHGLAEGFLLYWCLSARNLSDEALRVFRSLQARKLSQARRDLSRVVGRDTQGLPPSEIGRAVIETIGESFVDGFLSPVFWGLLLGAPGAFFFKAVSTGDSMIGHPEPPYRKFGWAAARLDDAMNFLPARLCPLVLLPAAFLSGLSVRGLWSAFGQDRLKHASPNAAHGEAAFAGALGVRLGGLNYYGGKSYRQAFLNESGRACRATDIGRAVRLLWAGAFVTLALLAAGGCWANGWGGWCFK